MRFLAVALFEIVALAVALALATPLTAKAQQTGTAD
jgi:hypothetical protein